MRLGIVHYWLKYRNVCCLLILLGVPASFLAAQAPLQNPSGRNLESEQKIGLDWKVNAAEATYRAGLGQTAESLFQSILAYPGIPSEIQDWVQIRLAGSLILQYKMDAAASALKLVSEEGQNSTYYLYRAAVNYGEGKPVTISELRAFLEQVDSVDLDTADLPWFYLLQGLENELEGLPEEAGRAFERARTASVSEQQSAYFESLILRQRLFQTPASEEIAAEIRQQMETFAGQVAEFTFAREYATVLFNLGRSQQAVEVLDGLIERNREPTRRDLEQVRLLKGIILGADSEAGRVELQNLIRTGSDRELMGIALQQLSQTDGGSLAAFRGFLNEMIDRPQPHLLLSQFYYLRSQLALADASGENIGSENRVAALLEAERDARILLEQFPGFGQLLSVYRLLAYTALQKDPPQYRAAADLLIQLRDQALEPEILRELNQLIGDCYFLNGDYPNAVDFYQAGRVIEGVVDTEDVLFLRLITAQVRSGQLDAAKQNIDQADFGSFVSASDRWRSEWNLAQALTANNQGEEALERVRSLLEGNRAGAVSGALDLRLRWLEARLALNLQDYTGLEEKINGILARIGSLPDGALDERDIELLRTEALLLRADLLIRNGSADTALDLLQSIRDEFPDSLAAVRSYLAEANYFASIDDLASAQEILVELATRYPNNEIATQALFEAALYCEQRGSDYFAEAIRIHEELASRYPEDGLVLPARLKQGDLLRLMNDFAGAQIIYESLINQFPEHPRRYVAQLSRADCLLALAKSDESQLSNVALTLEQLMDMPDLPIDFQAEAGYKWGFALAQYGEMLKAQEVWSFLVGRLLLDSSAAAKLGPSGRYWISRSLFELAQLLRGMEQLSEARLIYQKVLAYNLPGRNLAEAELSELPLQAE